MRKLNKLQIALISLSLSIALQSCTNSSDVNTYEKLLETQSISCETSSMDCQPNETQESANATIDENSQLLNENSQLLNEILNKNNSLNLLNEQNQLVMKFDSYDFDYQTNLDSAGRPTKLSDTADYSLVCTSWLDGNTFKFERVLTKYQDIDSRNPSNLYFEADLENKRAVSYEYRLNKSGEITDIITGIYLEDYFEDALNLYQQQILNKNFSLIDDNTSEISLVSESGRLYDVQLNSDKTFKSIKADQGISQNIQGQRQYSQVYSFYIEDNSKDSQNVLQFIDSSNTDLQKVICNIKYENCDFDVSVYSNYKMFIAYENNSIAMQNLPVKLIDSGEETYKIPNNLDFYVNAPINFELQ